MPSVPWQEPVRLTFGQLEFRLVNSPDEAVSCLITQWPNRRGPCFVKALTACRAAIAGRMDAEQARGEFVAAVREIESARS
ncbi:DUF982 domain-containing protein [Rhizobium sp. RAF56]|uniref:DUF982 domain-containing protein n=1 Tax=Rhizobium sp. RAF56 TaxID=3233062 RepID=UPI003F973241